MPAIREQMNGGLWPIPLGCCVAAEGLVMEVLLPLPAGE
jgi:hypothetical protein